MRDKDPIKIDIDRDRLMELSGEALRMIHEYLGGEFNYTKEQVLAKISDILSCGKIGSTFSVPIGSLKIPDLVLRVDPARREVLCKSAFRKKVARLNHYLNILKG